MKTTQREYKSLWLFLDSAVENDPHGGQVGQQVTDVTIVPISRPGCNVHLIAQATTYQTNERRLDLSNQSFLLRSKWSEIAFAMAAGRSRSARRRIMFSGE